MDRNTMFDIIRFVVENGRVQGGHDTEWQESLRVEVEFEAMKRGLSDASDIAVAAVAAVAHTDWFGSRILGRSAGASRAIRWRGPHKGEQYGKGT